MLKNKFLFSLMFVLYSIISYSIGSNMIEKEKFIKEVGLVIRTNFREGIIGERYVPVSTYTSNTGRSQTYYVDGNAVNIYTPGETRTSTSGGHQEEVHGYSALYRIDNPSNKNYLVTIKANWVGKYSKYQTYNDGTWGTGDTRTNLRSDRLTLDFTNTFLLEANQNFQEQFEVGEDRPSNFEIKVINLIELDDEYLNSIKRVLNLGKNTKLNIENGEIDIYNELKLIQRFLKDENMLSFQNIILDNLKELMDTYQTEYSKINIKKAVSKLEFNKDIYDPNFDNEGVLTINVSEPMSVRIRGERINRRFVVNKEHTEKINIRNVKLEDMGVMVVEVNDLKMFEEYDFFKITNIKDVDDYLKKYPNGKYVDEVKEKLENLYYINANNLDGYNNYLKEYPNGKYVKEVKEKIESYIKIFTKEIIGNMVKVEGGTFNMGGFRKNGNVTLSSFYMGKYEVRQSEFETVMGFNPSYFGILTGKNVGNNPVERVTWYDAVMYCNKLSEMAGLSPYYSISNIQYYNSRKGNPKNIENATVSIIGGKGYRLPTEAEWEYAARGGNKSQGYTYAGSNKIDEVAWYRGEISTKPVGIKKPNELGLYDMTGNIEEWCWDWYGDYTSSSKTNPIGPSSGSNRVRRGGHWRDFSRVIRVDGYGDSSRSARINSRSPERSDYDVGFRVARTF